MRTSRPRTASGWRCRRATIRADRRWPNSSPSSADDHSDELWVVALGTNDIGQYSSSDEIAAAVNEVIDAVPDESPLVWVDTYFRDQAEQQDSSTRSFVIVWPGVATASWRPGRSSPPAGRVVVRRCAPEHRWRRGVRVRRGRHRQRLPRPLTYTRCQAPIVDVSCPSGIARIGNPTERTVWMRLAYSSPSLARRRRTWTSTVLAPP